MDIKLAFLADRPDLIPTLCEWFAEIWAPYYGPDGPGNAAADLYAGCQVNALPVCLLAVDGAGEPMGTASLKTVSVADLPRHGPWLAALVVRPNCAGRGIANFLVQAIEIEAARRGETALYCDANTDETLKNPGGWEEADANLLVNRGWTAIGTGDSLRGVTAIFEFAIHAD
ncbi:MAG: GNAT family N-acetyltransferase [Alphaproteobacteria bacterium]|nr:GNAT family N-acetyltransferase [Alphaproteobacteria bacterium]